MSSRSEPSPFLPTPLICLVVTLKCSIAVDRDLYRYYGLANGYWFRVHPDRHLKIKRVFAAQCSKCKLRNPMLDHHGCPAGRLIMASVPIPDCLPEPLEILAYAHRKCWVDALSAV